MEPRRQDGPVSLLAAVAAGTFTVGVGAVAPGWVALPVGIAASVLVGYAFAGAATWRLVAGLLLAPLLAAVARGEMLWLMLLTLPVAAGIEFLLVRLGQHWGAPRSTSEDPEVRGRRVRLAIIVAVVAAVYAPCTIAGARMSDDADARTQMAAEDLRRALDRIEPGGVSPFDFQDVYRAHGGPPFRAAQPGQQEIRVTAEVSAGWERRCIRGVREQGRPATVEILPEACS